MGFLHLWLFVSFLGPVSGDFPFRNISLPWHDRVDNLVGLLDITEIMLQMAKGGAGEKGGPAPAIDRLGIGPYQWNEECLRGAASAGKATAFPQSIGLAAAFSPSLIYEIAEATGVEVRAKHNDYVKKKEYGDHKGLSCFSPVINIMRHPLWGRNQETYGEDPYLTGVYAEQYVKGLQGDHPRYIRANAGCKHFDAYAGPENFPVTRLAFDAKVSERDWRLTFLPAFHACVKAGTYSLMCSYNSLNGIPACANDNLLTEVLRKEWGFKGYVISDEVALEFIITQHKYFNNTLDTAAACVKAGCNIELSGNNPAVYLRIEDAVKQGKLEEALVRERVKPLFYTRMRLGEFDPDELNPYLRYNMSDVQSPAHQSLAVKAAMQTFVLLKNDRQLLPLQKVFKKIAIVGPMADNIHQLYGDYAADVDPKTVKTPYKGLQGLGESAGFAAGCKDNRCTDYHPEDIKLATLGSELTIICVGTGQELESEGNDRHSMDLAGNQTQLIKDAVDFTSGGAVLLLVFSAGPVNISFAERDPRVTAIMQCFFPAQATGEALNKTLTKDGFDASPAGRLPYTWYEFADQVPSITNYTMEGRTYRYFKGTPLYPFGYGLSYTIFSYSNLVLTPEILAGDDQEVMAYVFNKGSVDSYEVIQVYMSWENASVKMPNLQLVGFDRIFLGADSGQTVKFRITSEQMAVWTDNGWFVQAGIMRIYVGGQQPDQVKTVGSNVLTETFKIDGQNKYLGKY